MRAHCVREVRARIVFDSRVRALRGINIPRAVIKHEAQKETSLLLLLIRFALLGETFKNALMYQVVVGFRV